MFPFLPLFTQNLPLLHSAIIADSTYDTAMIDMMPSILAADIRSPRTQYVPIYDLKTVSDFNALKLFRFTVPQINDMIDAMQLPPSIITDSKHTVSTFDAMCILLRRLVYPNRLFDLTTPFGMSNTTLSRIINGMAMELGNRFNDFIALWPGLSIDRVHEYSDVVSAHTDGVITDVWGFVDGTLRYMCRPNEMQEASYSGHKHTHGQKFQSIISPDGLIVSLLGPYGASRPDIVVYVDSNTAEMLYPYTRHDDHSHYLLGDKAYQTAEQVIVPYSTPRSQHESAYNALHSSVRIAVEWGFGKVVRYFAYINYKTSLRVHLQPIALLYKLAVLFTNIHTCINSSSQPSSLFNMNVPTLQEYFQYH
jgi:nuclease HARBI1